MLAEFTKFEFGTTTLAHFQAGIWIKSFWNLCLSKNLLSETLIRLNADVGLTGAAEVWFPVTIFTS